MNVHESEKLAAICENMGYTIAEKREDADLIVFNTCAIREGAEDRVFGNIGSLKKLKKQNPNLIIAVCGCMTQKETTANQILSTFPFVDIVIGTFNLPNFEHYVSAVKTGRQLEILQEGEIDESVPYKRSSGENAWVNIMQGCNNFCTYCVVPYTRGVEMSRPVEDILREARRLAETGSVELNLLGQNVNSYHGEDANGKERNLAYLLYKVAEIDGIKRIRYTTSYPADVDDDLIRCHKELDKLMPYLHLPIQSGSDSVLKRMNRRHTRDDYLRVVDKLKEANPAIGMSSDFIVGFPGESDDDFKQTLEVVNRVKYIQAFSFKYSRRPGTPAAVMEGQIEEKVKKERLQVLQDLLFSYQTKFNKDSVGKIMPVLFETKGRHKGQLAGRSPYMQNVHAAADMSLLNKIVDVRIVDASTNSLSGEVA